jgi:hypothetical protein
VIFFGTGYQVQSECAVTYDGAQAAGSRYTASGAAGSPNAAMYNILDQGTDPLTEPTILRVFNWNDWATLRSAPDAHWLTSDTSSPGGNPRHMLTSGYTGYRNPAYAEAAGLSPGFATLGEPSEVDTAQTLARRKTRTLAEPAQADTAQAIGRRKTITLGIAVDTSAAAAVVRRKRSTLGLAAETDAASPISPPGQHRVTLGLPAETDTAQGLTRRKTVTLGIAVDLATALGPNRRKSRVLGQPSEVDGAQPAAPRKTRPVAQASELDSALPLVLVPAVTDRIVHRPRGGIVVRP